MYAMHVFELHQDNKNVCDAYMYLSYIMKNGMCADIRAKKCCNKGLQYFRTVYIASFLIIFFYLRANKILGG